jgi:hypothetical protein
MKLDLSKKLELILLFFYFPLAGMLGFLLKLDLIMFTATYSLIPAIFISFRLKGFFKRNILETFVFSIPFLIIFVYIAAASKSWFAPSVLEWRFLGKVPVEEFIAGPIYVYLLIVIYEYFFDKSKTRKISPKFVYLLYLIVLAIGIFFTIFMFNKDLLVIAYFYTILCFVFLVVIALGFLAHPKLFVKIALAEVFILVPSIIHELVSYELHHWVYEYGNHVGYLNIGHYVLPIEAVLWWVLAMPVILIMHENFGDNNT